MSLTIIRNARVVSPKVPQGHSGPLRGSAMAELEITPLADVTIESGLIKKVLPVAAPGKRRPPVPTGTNLIDAAGRVLLPGFVDCHTHACWAGDRYDEWDMKRRGVPYLEILKRGGGIMSTVRAVREATEEQLAELLLQRLNVMLRCGTTTVEVKSGYGLSTADELKMLRAIARVAAQWPGTVRSTALLGHAIDEQQPGFVGVTVRQTLPAIAQEFLPGSGLAVDAFCEQSAWSLDQCILLLSRAKDMGYPIRVHADQFNSLGMVAAAIRLGTRTVDHLEVTTKEDIAALGESSTIGVYLPMSPLHLSTPQGKPRQLIAAGGAVAVASNFNPGSGPSPSIPLTIAMAVRHLQLSHAEAIAATTHNAAAVLDLADRGSIVPGKRADLVLMRHRDERAIAFELGEPGVDAVFVAGSMVYQQADPAAGGRAAGGQKLTDTPTVN